ncbi:hypothetical protein LV89_02848 [Arcicella aurantiaca]|uniref:Uncharacterized protein n=1 Tax=Arcicella aurantiaca TaxID=591202 RepID=A0A316E6Q3_9BACT|nr:EboA domain-containing protein [Arcicella aurantiaca]PWK25222.1 hypothetical protein LV89_02848 [Arcicella aurantiaca]
MALSLGKYQELLKMVRTLDKIFEIIQENANEKELAWLNEKISNAKSTQLAFVSAPRFIGKRLISFEIEGNQTQNWTFDRLVRVYLLLKLEEMNPEGFEEQINMLFDTAEIHESIALYSALPLFQNPEKWLLRATDAVRSNVGDIFDSIAFNNVYPVKYFSELAWNQLVLKCIFNEKPIHQIIGLDSRANQHLADTLSDFAHERWAAGRRIPSQVWRLVTNFLNEIIIKDLESLFLSNDLQNQIAATLVCSQTTNSEAKDLLNKYSLAINPEMLSWEYLENQSAICYG